MKIVLTGCSGYVASRLAPRLRRAGHELTGIDRAPPPPALELDRFTPADLLEPDSYRSALAGADLICHLAAAKGDWGISEAEYERDNVAATRALIEAAHSAGVRRWIFYSTVSALGPSDIPIPEESPRRPANAYGRSKAKCEELYERYLADNPDAHLLNIRPSVVYGPDNPWNTNIFRLIDAIHRNRFLMIGRGGEVKTTSFIDNLVEAQLFLMERHGGGSGIDTYHYVDAPALTTAELVARIHALLGKRPLGLRLPLALASPLALVGDAAAALTGIDLPITSARVRKFCTSTNFSSEKVRRFGYAQPVSNDEALRRTVEWYCERYLPGQAAATKR